MKTIAVVNGPNLNLIGKREPEIYGTQTMEQMYVNLQREFPNIRFIYFQSNHEGDLIDKIQEFGYSTDGIILNAGGYTHTSIAIRDAIAAIPIKVIEVHLTDITKREDFRKVDFLTDVCAATIMGKGILGYVDAAKLLSDEK